MIHSTNYSIGGIGIQVNFLCPFFVYLPKSGSKLFEKSTQNTPTWTINFDISKNISISNMQTAFTGADTFEEEIPYKWKLLSSNDKKYIHFEFEKDIFIDTGLAEIDSKNKTISVQLKLIKEEVFGLDPFFHPLGILMLQYIVHLEHGFVMHASTVSYKGKGFLFSAVSGTGKSTMAKIWQQKGATIINDDRIIVMPSGNGYALYNTPMPYYIDQNKSVQLNNLFIIKQSKENYIKQLNSTHGILAILGNCMQYQFDKNQIKERLDIISNTCNYCKVHEVGFKPDTDIVDLILEQFG